MSVSLCTIFFTIIGRNEVEAASSIGSCRRNSTSGAAQLMSAQIAGD